MLRSQPFRIAELRFPGNPQFTGNHLLYAVDRTATLAVKGERNSRAIDLGFSLWEAHSELERAPTREKALEWLQKAGDRCAGITDSVDETSPAAESAERTRRMCAEAARALEQGQEKRIPKR